jgi:chromosome partitioning protein
MNVITMISGSRGGGKTTLAAQLAAFASVQGRRCLVLDADPRGSFTLYNSRRADGALPLATVRGGIDRQLEIAEILGYEWVIIDTPPDTSTIVEEAVRVATMLIIPARPGIVDRAPVRETAERVARAAKPYAVVFNAAPAKGGGAEAIVVSEARAFFDAHFIPVWSGQISECADFAPAIGKADGRVLAAAEISQLWSMLDRSVAAIDAAHVRLGHEPLGHEAQAA